jgi:hypothetical protein
LGLKEKLFSGATSTVTVAAPTLPLTPSTNVANANERTTHRKAADVANKFTILRRPWLFRFVLPRDALIVGECLCSLPSTVKITAATRFYLQPHWLSTKIKAADEILTRRAQFEKIDVIARRTLGLNEAARI